MGKRKSVHLEKQQLDGIEEMHTSGEADNQSEALRMALNAGLSQYGYLNAPGTENDSRLRKTSRRFADAFGLLAVFLVGGTFLLPVEWRTFAVVPLFMSLACYGFDRLLKVYEPELTERLGLILGGGEQA